MDFITKEHLFSSGDIKQEAKAQLKGRWRSVILLCLVPVIIAVILFSGISFTVVLGGGTAEGNNTAVDFILNAGSGLISVGILYTLIDLIRKPTYRISPLKNAFQVFTTRYFTKNLFIYLLIYLFVFLWSLLLVIPGIIKSLAYSQSHYIYKNLSLDGTDERVSVSESITESRYLMDGHKMDLFVLELSFIGWHFLSILLLGIPYIWLTPYLEMSRAVFYENLAKDYFDRPISRDNFNDSFEEEGFTDF